MSQTNEKAVESYVETILLNQAGWQSGTVAAWDEARALFPARVQNPPKQVAKLAA